MDGESYKEKIKILEKSISELKSEFSKKEIIIDALVTKLKAIENQIRRVTRQLKE